MIPDLHDRLSRVRADLENELLCSLYVKCEEALSDSVIGVNRAWERLGEYILVNFECDGAINHEIGFGLRAAKGSFPNDFSVFKENIESLSTRCLLNRLESQEIKAEKPCSVKMSNGSVVYLDDSHSGYWSSPDNGKRDSIKSVFEPIAWHNVPKRMREWLLRKEIIAYASYPGFGSKISINRRMKIYDPLTLTIPEGDERWSSW